ncbi:MAG: ABC transporter ATP-binding protein [Nitrospinaceae bacterium]|nr:ABC transporter ATP-binding protein [Nitrospinaceae bacterium]
MTDKKPVLSVENLTVKLPDHADRLNAIEEVSFDVRPNEILCVVGESGSGKSVTAHTVMGLLPPKQLKPTAGRILLQDENLFEKSELELREMRGAKMSMIFQEPMTALNPVVTVGDQIEEVLRIHRHSNPKERAKLCNEVMEAVNLPEPEKLRKSYPHQLSGGQRQRIMIAAALILEPFLLIADEPTTALDVTTQAQILRLIRDIQAKHDTGVLFITHDFGVVAEIADRVVVMQDGKIVEVGETHELLRNPQESYTRMLISSVPSLTPKARNNSKDSNVVLSTQSLSKIYGEKSFFRKTREVNAVQDVNIEIRKGETLGIVGESGSGKSTVARCIVRLINPTSGGIYIDDDEIAELPESSLRPHRRRVQIIFQDPYRSLNPRRTVGQSIVEGPMNYGLDKDSAWTRATELLKLVDIDSKAIDRFPHQFSGGQRQRICIARALAMEPEVLIADEAVSALDVSVQSQVLDLLDDVRKKFDLAMLFITHDLRVASQICDNVAVMCKGMVVEQGKSSEVFKNPKHSYTQELFNAAPGRNFNFGEFETTV